MSSDAAAAVPLAPTVGRTGAALGVVVGRRDSRLVLAAATLGYLAVYLFAVGDLALTGGGGFAVTVADDPLGTALRSSGYFSFWPIARVEAFGLTYLFSPVDALIAVVLAALVGANLALTYLGQVQPKACGLESSAGALAAIPALLSGAACCGPVILIVAGIQATGLLIAGFQVLVPVAALLLVASLLLIGRQVNPELL